MNKQFRIVAVSLLMALPIVAEAHRGWIVPSTTVLSEKDGWVTFDAAVSNDIFHPDHSPMRVDALQVWSPSGQETKVENAATGKLRTVFDLQLNEQGTWKLFTASSGLMARWEEKGERKFWPPRGMAYTQEGFAKAVPQKAEKLEVTQSSRRLETFVTAGAPTNAVFKPTNVGLELVPVTHPNDLVADDKAVFTFLMDGKPAANVEIEIVPGERRYRNAEEAIELKTDKEGKVEISWPHAGQYWLEASYEDNKAQKPATKRKGVYVATFEVLP